MFQAKLKHFDIKSCLCRPRSVSFALKAVINEELDRLVNVGFFEKVTSSDWVLPIVPVPKKDGKIQICGDYKVTVNQSLIVYQHPLLTPEELFVTLTGG